MKMLIAESARATIETKRGVATRGVRGGGERIGTLAMAHSGGKQNMAINNKRWGKTRL